VSKGAENRLLRGWICRVGCACALDLGAGLEWYASATGQWLPGGTADVLSYPAKSTTPRFVRGRVSKARRLPGKVLPGGPQPWVEEPKGPINPHYGLGRGWTIFQKPLLKMGVWGGVRAQEPFLSGLEEEGSRWVCRECQLGRFW
jgi:hypothetical protein